jgi:hypothetical protein
MSEINISFEAWLLISFTVMMFWYIFVEVIFWAKYFFRNSLERYNYSWINRFFHYAFWWTLIYFLLIFLYKSWYLIDFFVNNMWYSNQKAYILSYFLGAIVIFWLVFIITSLVKVLIKKVSKSKFIKNRKKKNEPKKKLKLKIQNEKWE